MRAYGWTTLAFCGSIEDMTRKERDMLVRIAEGRGQLLVLSVTGAGRSSARRLRNLLDWELVRIVDHTTARRRDVDEPAGALAVTADGMAIIEQWELLTESNAAPPLVGRAA